MTRLALLLGLAACGSRDPAATDRVVYVRHDGADMMVWIRGNVASGRLLVVVHGGPGGESTVYVPELSALEGELAVAYWDQRGSGASRGAFPASTMTYEQFGADLDAVVRALDDLLAPTDLFVMGHSFGVEVGTEYLVGHELLPSVRGWLPVDGTHSVVAHANGLRAYVAEQADDIAARPEVYEEEGYLFTDDELELLATWRAEADEPAPTPLPREDLDLWWDRARAVPLRPVEEVDAEVTYPNGWMSPSSPRLSWKNEDVSYFPLDRAYIDFDRTEELGAVTLPVAALWGRWDPIIPVSIGYAYVAALGTPEADVSLTVFPNAYHSPMIEEQQPFLEAVRAFVARYATP